MLPIWAHGKWNTLSWLPLMPPNRLPQYLARGCAIDEDSWKTEKMPWLYETSQAWWAYRQMSLLRRPPVSLSKRCILHSRLLERAARLNDEHGECTPIIRAGMYRLIFRPTLFRLRMVRFILNPISSTPASSLPEYQYPVSRVSSSKTKTMKKVAAKFETGHMQYRELAAFQFGTELDKATKLQIDRGKESRKY